MRKPPAATSRASADTLRVVRLAHLCRPVAESDIVAGHDSATEREAAERDRRRRSCEIRPSMRRDAANPRSSVSSRRLWRGHNSGKVGGHGHPFGATVATVALQQRGSSGPVNESIRAGLGRPLLGPDGSSHATSRRLTAAPMNRRADRALPHGLRRTSEQTHHARGGAVAPPRQAPTRLRIAGLDGQRLVDRRVDATVRRRDRHDRCSSKATTRTPASRALAIPCGAAVPARRRLVAACGR